MTTWREGVGCGESAATSKEEDGGTTGGVLQPAVRAVRTGQAAPWRDCRADGCLHRGHLPHVPAALPGWGSGRCGVSEGRDARFSAQPGRAGAGEQRTGKRLAHLTPAVTRWRAAYHLARHRARLRAREEQAAAN